MPPEETQFLVFWVQKKTWTTRREVKRGIRWESMGKATAEDCTGGVNHTFDGCSSVTLQCSQHDTERYFVDLGSRLWMTGGKTCSQAR